MPLTDAETPARASGSGRAAANCVDGASWVPKTLRIMPGAKAGWNEAPLLTPPMLMVEEGPTSNTTGISMACGVGVVACKISVAL